MDIKKITQEYYEYLSAHKCDNLDEIDQLLETHNLLKLTQEKIDNLNRPISIKEIESIIINLSKKSIRPRFVLWEFYQTFKEEITPVLYGLFQKIEAEGIVPDSYYEASIILIPKPKTLQEKKTTDLS
ncbi:hypothetical protein mRhiFer1_010112 [Rhinolophus ferrumequinum]|uniref:Uncharacterized protein n=1 Tax=Rhinolophus ferrumequinum TaxID=59479 RepID=A0A7J7XPN8_RHIFE|nr:hypothetical protein mRhiFer1_010112 [Rhinolophus ferrumequinum]